MPVTPEQQQAAERIERQVEVGLEPDPRDIDIVKEAAEQAKGTPDWSGEVITPSGKTGEEVLREVSGQKKPETPTERLEVQKQKEQREESVKAGIRSTDVLVGDDMYITSKQAESIKKQSPEMYEILTEQGYEAYQRAQKAEQFVAFQEKKDFLKAHEKPGEGELWLTKESYEDLPDEQKKVYKEKGYEGIQPYYDKQTAEYEANRTALEKLGKYTDSKGFVDGAAYLRDHPGDSQTLYDAGFKSKDLSDWNVYNLAYYAKDTETGEAVKPERFIVALYRAMTPWDESAGQTFIEYMKGYPGRVKETFISKDTWLPPEKAQEALKAEYEAEQSLPAWARVLFGGNVAKDPNKDIYYPVVAGEAPMIGGKAGVAKKAIKTLAQYEEMAAWEMGLSGFMRREFLTAKTANPKLTLEVWKVARENGIPFKDAIKLANKGLLVSKAEDVDKLWRPVAQGEKVTVAPKLQTKTMPKIDLAGLNKEINKSNFKVDWNDFAKAMEQGKINDTASASQWLEKNKALVGTDISPVQTKQIIEALSKARAAQLEREAAKVAEQKASSDLLKQLTQKELPAEVERESIGEINREIREQIKERSELKPKEIPQSKIEVEASEKAATAIAVALSTQTELSEETKTQVQELVETQLEEITDTKVRTLAQEKVDDALKAIFAPESELKSGKNTKLPDITVTTSDAGKKIEPPSSPKSNLKPPSTKRETGKEPPGEKSPPSPKTGIVPTPPPPPDQRKKPPKLPRISISGDKDEEEWTPSQIKSAVAWKQGRTVFAVKSPYRQQDMRSFSVKKAPAGLVIHERGRGKGSAQKSAIVTGQFPNRLTVDVGFEDLVITKQGSRPLLTFRPDPGARTVSMLTTKRIGHGRRKKRRSRIVY